MLNLFCLHTPAWITCSIQIQSHLGFKQFSSVYNHTDIVVHQAMERFVQLYISINLILSFKSKIDQMVLSVSNNAKS